jgi:CheY-like chemotaxis protein
VSAQDQTPVRVLVVDDSEVFRDVMCAVVAETPGFEVAGVASSGRETLALVGSLAVEFVLVDVQMPYLDSIETGLQIRRRHPEVVVLLLTAASRARASDPSLMLEDKRDLSPEWLADFWQRHGPMRRTLERRRTVSVLRPARISPVAHYTWTVREGSLDGPVVMKNYEYGVPDKEPVEGQELYLSNGSGP